MSMFLSGSSDFHSPQNHTPKRSTKKRKPFRRLKGQKQKKRLLCESSPSDENDDENEQDEYEEELEFVQEAQRKETLKVKHALAEVRRRTQIKRGQSRPYESTVKCLEMWIKAKNDHPQLNLYLLKDAEDRKMSSALDILCNEVAGGGKRKKDSFPSIARQGEISGRFLETIEPMFSAFVNQLFRDGGTRADAKKEVLPSSSNFLAEAWQRQELPSPECLLPAPSTFTPWPILNEDSKTESEFILNGLDTVMAFFILGDGTLLNYNRKFKHFCEQHGIFPSRGSIISKVLGLDERKRKETTECILQVLNKEVESSSLLLDSHKKYLDIRLYRFQASYQYQKMKPNQRILTLLMICEERQDTGLCAK